MNWHLFLGNVFWCLIKRFPLQTIFCCDMSLSDIPKSTIFPHAVGIVVNTTTKMGENVWIYQNVTIGGRHWNAGEGGATIGDNVAICNGAIILGPVTIGENSVIGAGAIVLHDIPPNTVYTNRIIPRMHRRKHELPRVT